MKVFLMMFLALMVVLPLRAQELSPAAHRDTVKVDSATVIAAADKPLSFKRHFFTGAAVGMLAAGAGFYIEAKNGGFSDCIGCEIVVPIVVLASGVAGGIIGGVVYGVRRLSAREQARRAALAPRT